MNIEFTVLSDGNVEVTNENGLVSKVKYDDNVKEVLLSENKIEIVDNKLEKLKKDLSSQEGVLFQAKWMLIFQPIILSLATLVMFIYGGVTSPDDFLTYAIYNGVKGFVYGSIICGTTVGYYSIVKPIYNKKRNKTKSEIEITEKLKENYEKELSDIKENNQIINSQIISINKPVSLIEQTSNIETQINDEINKTYVENFKKQPKKLVLGRKK